MNELDPRTRDALAELLLAVADDEFVIGFWDSEWTGIAPMLEEDVAMSSISQDEIGHARALYELLADLTGADADAIAFGREAAAFRHAALLNHRRRDWAFTIARRYCYETADGVRLGALVGSSYAPLAELAAKMRREESYHLMHVGTWLDRLAEGAHDRLQEGLDQAWPDAQAVFTPPADEEALITAGIVTETWNALHDRWLGQVGPALERLHLRVNPATVPADGRTRRTDDFAWLHGEFTSVARAEAGATW
jgi:ring-1,2-phenylacetyl-CoA epoxidase subunit PaaC